MRCEVNASQAAMAYAKLHGSLGCCIATSGPGAGHLLSGLVDADQDRVPLLCITGLKSAGAIRHSDFQDSELVECGFASFYTLSRYASSSIP